MRIKLIDFGGKTPVRKHYNNAGADIFSPRDQTIYPGQVYSFPFGFGLELPDGFTGFIFPRSSLSAKGIVCELPPIDSGYRGEIHAVVSNVGNTGYDIKEGDRIGQLMILPCMIPEFTYEDAAECGTGAFGSSSK
ncbi:MAG: deoxyuridine 5'-triphosphate nucleotidohydrolase [Ruminococcus sp.]|nr:deoxyuridine 5'-triphosphate nucleotidohydrolase [Ruminococcus sp.]